MFIINLGKQVYSLRIHSIIKQKLLMKVSTRISAVSSSEVCSEKINPVNRKSSKFIVWSSLVLLAFFMISSNVSFGQVAAWTFDATAAAPSTPNSLTANLGTQSGTATLYADGTNGSSSWVTASGGTNELTAFAGTVTNDPRGTPVVGFAYSPVAATGFTANGKKMVFKFSMTSLQDPILTYATRNTATGFQSQAWEWSTDNVTYTPFFTVSTITTSFVTKTVDLTAINSVDNAATVYLRITYSGATNAAGNCRIDNVVINASPFALGNQTITGFPTTDTRTYGIAPYNITGVTGGGSGNPVTFASDNPAIASVSGNTVTINSVGAGTVHITASQAGNGSYNAATDVIQTLTVNKATQIITFGSLINRNDVDANFQLTATGGGSTSPVLYTSSLTSVAQIVNSNVSTTPDPNGNWVDITGAGQTTITASQAGDGNYLAATSVQQTQIIINTSLSPQIITFNPLANKTYGDANFQLTATGGGSANPVTYTSSDPSIAVIVNISGVVDPNGTYVKIIGPGTTTITASQAGDGVTYNPATPVPQSFTVDKKTLTVSGATVDTRAYNAGVAATISNASLNGVISPDVVNFATLNGTFADPNANTGIAVTANLTLGGADAAKYLLQQPTGLTGTITQATQTITFTGPLANRSPGDANFNYTATASSGLTVSFTSGTPSVITIVSGSLAHVGVIGSSLITATQAGNQNYTAAAPVALTQNVVAAAPVSIFANLINDANPSLANPFTAGQTVNSNITVSGIGRGPGIVGTAATNRYNANTWNVAGFDATKYFEFVITPNSGYLINFSSFVYAGQVSSTTPPNAFAFRTSVDGFTNNVGTPTATGATISLSAAGYQNISGPITFRLYAWGAASSTATFSVNDFIFNGNVIVAPPTATFTKTNVSYCAAVNDGSITVTPSGTGPFHYSWSGITGSGNPATTPYPNPGDVATVTGLSIGYYNVTVTDANLNSATITGIHIENAFSVFITNSGSTSSACANTGSIILYGNAGVQPYSYSLDGITYQPSNTFTGLAAGPYTARVKDAAGCVSNKNITVAAAAALVSSPFARNPSSCANDGSIEIYRSGGITPYSYSLDGITYQSLTNKYSNLGAGNYVAYVKDATGCVASAPVTLTAGAGLTVTASKTNTSSCDNDGTIQLNASGGVAPYTYSIDGGSTYQSSNSFTGLSANSYSVKVKDFKGCTSSDLGVTINVNTIVVTSYAVAASNCLTANGSIQLFRTGGVGPYTYSLDGSNYQSSSIFTGLAPDFYIGYVKDSKTCIAQSGDIVVGPESCLGRSANSRSSINNNNTSHVARVQASSELKVQAYPNPTATEFMLQLDGYSNDKVVIIVTDIMGRKVYQAEGTGKQQYRFGNKFNSGLYNVQVIQGNDKKSIKLVKE